MKLNQEDYDKLIKEDVIWLKNNTKASVERSHILSVLKMSVGYFYQDDRCNCNSGISQSTGGCPVHGFKL